MKFQITMVIPPSGLIPALSPTPRRIAGALSTARLAMESILGYRATIEIAGMNEDMRDDIMAVLERVAEGSEAFIADVVGGD